MVEQVALGTLVEYPLLCRQVVVEVEAVRHLQEQPAVMVEQVAGMDVVAEGEAVVQMYPLLAAKGEPDQAVLQS
jgi:hypothetical protein